MSEIERIIWKAAIFAIGIVTMLAVMKGMTSWTEQKSAEAKSEKAEQVLKEQQEAEQQRELDDYIKSLHVRETERRNTL